MSSVPKAKKSTVSNLTVQPDLWDHYPTVEYSTITSCTFKNLNSHTRIERSNLNNVILEGGTRKIVLERSDLANCSVVTSPATRTGYMSENDSHDVRIERSQLKNCIVASAHHIARVEAQDTNFVGCKHVERTKFEDSSVIGANFIERSTIVGSLLADSTWCERSSLDKVVITKSKVDRSLLTDCDVMECEIAKTEFHGMILKYGIWRNGELVGRTCKKEVVIRPRDSTSPQQPTPQHPITQPSIPISSANQSSIPHPTPSIMLKSAVIAEPTQDDAATIVTSDSDSILENDDSPEPENHTIDLSSTKERYVETSQRQSSHMTGNLDESDPPPPYEEVKRM